MKNDHPTLGEQLGIYDDFKDIVITDDQNNVITYSEFWNVYDINDEKICIISIHNTNTKITNYIK